ncbi:phosphotransferase [Lacinutrix sp. C3R15]|uniref:phosphotransferase n=1 Tax=Flavobacteriaceae TaxID=49546 RepID=UPI001C099E43|nr:MULTISPECIES: phosphotransferase [Flavobacteriaceae]MBU2939531.1 phosphotransferase [Lacinutrix sp. C3R15]MDO6622846.1 phosphotransferase [Oceanihabitans sp. 1_MG-2023]
MFIDLQTPKEDIKKLLQEINFFNTTNEYIINITKPGEGNMNVVLRIETNMRSFIAKQSRPFVQKYKDIEAPIKRIDVEYQFYKTISSNALLNKHFPKVLKYNAENHLLILEDLGACEDMTYLYNTRTLETKQLELLVQIVANIHNAKAPKDYPENKELRLLNYQHIFELPFIENNGFSLNEIQAGLETLSLPYKKDAVLKQKIKEIGSQYLSEGTTLIHGDFYPGSWMTKNNQIYSIDPEFSFLGFKEFDLGVLAAHSILILQNKSALAFIKKSYPSTINAILLEQVTGIEIMRRLIGLAQLPITRSLKEKENLLQLAYTLIMKGTTKTDT